jgi:N-acetylglucosaminyldiphosphoundecaprenol N-acetyl-beta-D-mannosaminyltransferase
MIKTILGIRVSPTSYASAADQIRVWAQAGESRYICAANVHVLMTAHDSDAFNKVINHADLITPDGMPLVWIWANAHAACGGDGGQGENPGGLLWDE